MARPPYNVEREDICDGEAVDSDRIGRLNSRLGGDVRGSLHRRSVVSGGGPVPHILPGDASSVPRAEVFCQRQKKRLSAAEIGQHLRRILREQAVRDSVPQIEQNRERPCSHLG